MKTIPLLFLIVAVLSSPLARPQSSSSSASGNLQAAPSKESEPGRKDVGRVTKIEHPDKDLTVIRTMPNGTHVVETLPQNSPSREVGTFGAGREHGDVVRDYMPSGSKIIFSPPAGGGAGDQSSKQEKPVSQAIK